MEKLCKSQPQKYQQVGYKNCKSRLLGFLLVAEYIPLANREQRQMTNREDNERAVTGDKSGITAEAPRKEDLEAMGGSPGTPGINYMYNFLVAFVM